MGRREEKKQQTRQDLTETALDLFRTRGFDETRVQDIVEQVGVSPATFFNYFPSKDAILEAQAEETTELYAALLRHELTRTDASVEDRLGQITRLLGAFLSTDVEISRLMATRTQLFFGTSGARAESVRAAQQLLTELFEQGQDSGEMTADTDAEQLTELFTAMFLMTSTNWLVEWWGPTSQPLEERMVDALAVLLRGIRNR